MKSEAALQQLADTLWQARTRREAIAPLRDAAERLDLALTPEHAYAIQRSVRDRRVRAGDRVVGRKIGLTSPAVQRQLGVDQPDFGDLWASCAFGDGDTVPMSTLMQPKVEAEVAIVLERDLAGPVCTAADVIRATAFALPALEIVDSRIADWNIRLFDTIADNASAGAFVLGADPVPLTQLRLREAGMHMRRGDEEVSRGLARDCLGHPMQAAAWLARTLAALGDPLRAGDIVLTGALGPMCAARSGDRFEATIAGLGSVAVQFD